MSDNSTVCLTKHSWRGTTWYLVTAWRASVAPPTDSVPGASVDLCSSSSTCMRASAGATMPGGALELCSFAAAVTDGTNVWRGEASRAHVEKHLAPEGFAVGEYLLRTKNAIVGSGSSPNTLSSLDVLDDLQPRAHEESCSISVTSDGRKATLSWRLPLEDDSTGAAEGIRLHGELVLQRVSVERGRALDFVLDMVGVRLAELEAHKAAARREAERCAAENAHMKEVLEKLTAYKEALEHDMYAKFCVVLNEKKRKIQELTQQVSMLRADLEAQKLALGSALPEPPQPLPPATSTRTRRKRQAQKQKPPQTLPEEEESDEEYAAAGGKGYVATDQEDDSDGDVVFSQSMKEALTTTEKGARQSLDLLGLSQRSSSSNLLSSSGPADPQKQQSPSKPPAPQTRARKRHAAPPPSAPTPQKRRQQHVSAAQSPSRSPYRRRTRAAEQETEMGATALFDHLD